MSRNRSVLVTASVSIHSVSEETGRAQRLCFTEQGNGVSIHSVSEETGS